MEVAKTRIDFSLHSNPSDAMVTHSVKLYGFDWPTQDRLTFNSVWASAFLNHRFTNESHEALATSTYISDADKKREVKYGNSISALFRALVHLGREGGQPQEGFWAAIARGFNTNASTLRETVDILTEARKLRQTAFAREVSETARAADEWINFMDHCFQTNPIRPLDQFDQSRIVLRFLSTLEGKLVNEARIPLHPVPRRMLLPSGNRRTPPSSISSNSVLLRKRSASPMPTNRSPDMKRICGDRPGNEAKICQNVKQEQEPMHQPIERQREVPKHGPNGIGGRELGPSREILDGITAMVEEVSAMAAAKPVADIATTREATNVKETVETQNTTEKASDNNMNPNKLEQEMAGMKNIMAIMMESMHTIVDSLSGIKDDIVNNKQKPGNEVIQSQAQLSRGAPTTFRQAMAAAEKDLRYHSDTLSKFYQDQNSYFSRQDFEGVRNFLRLLDEGMRLADKLK